MTDVMLFALCSEAFSLTMAYLIGTYFMASLLVIRNQFPNFQHVGFEIAFGPTRAASRYHHRIFK